MTLANMRESMRQTASARWLLDQGHGADGRIGAG